MYNTTMGCAVKNLLIKPQRRRYTEGAPASGQMVFKLNRPNLTLYFAKSTFNSWLQSIRAWDVYFGRMKRLLIACIWPYCAQGLLVRMRNHSVAPSSPFTPFFLSPPPTPAPPPPPFPPKKGEEEKQNSYSWLSPFPSC